MEEKIRSLYTYVIEKEGINRNSENMKKQILEFIQEEGICVEEGAPRLEDFAFRVAAIGEEEGFVQGFCYAVQLLTECF